MFRNFNELLKFAWVTTSWNPQGVRFPFAFIPIENLESDKHTFVTLPKFLFGFPWKLLELAHIIPGLVFPCVAPDVVRK